jgi:REP element-mobilizing transposase RayT
MPEHAHLVVTGLQDNSDVWNCMSQFKQQTGYWLAKHSGGEWQKAFYDHVIRHREDFKKQVYYIVNNPVRRSLVENWDDYPFTGSIGIDLKEVLSEILESESPSGRAG